MGLVLAPMPRRISISLSALPKAWRNSPWGVQNGSNGRSSRVLRTGLERLKTLVQSVNRHQVDDLLIGAYALFVHGYHRATSDIDILAPATKESGAKVKTALMVLPDQTAKTAFCDVRHSFGRGGKPRFHFRPFFAVDRNSLLLR
jgi:hypothetical protein